MKSQTSLAARNCRLQEWSKMVHSCNNRPIGMSVDEWCRENSITTANYYYRMTQVRKACLDSLSDEAVNQEVVPVPMNLVAPAEEPCIKAASITCQTPAKNMLSPELKKLLNDLQAGESNIRIDREKIQAELEALDNTPVFLKHSLSMSTRVCPTCGRKL